VVDAVSQVLELSPADIEPPPAFGTSVRVDYLLGLGKFGNRFVLLLDIDRVLSAAELLKAASLESQEAEPPGEEIAPVLATETGRKPRGAADPTNVRA
jgi:purine-binding chemotaxis protein CheW